MEQCVFPEPEVPDKIMACGYPVSVCWRTVSCTIFFICGANGKERIEVRVNGFPTPKYGLMASKIGPTFVWKREEGLFRKPRDRIKRPTHIKGIVLKPRVQGLHDRVLSQWTGQVDQILNVLQRQSLLPLASLDNLDLCFVACVLQLIGV